ncbi:MAG TPA: PIN domain-containing protein [Terriglobia bacterium]|jgi:predicted nucleic acid-binding protein|nr:PIN domain-containing protein [Terriglobia bacterium]
MPRFLADTSLIIDLINDRSGRREFVARLLQPGDTLGYCTINAVEVYTGMRPGEEGVTALWLDRLLYYEVTLSIAKGAGALRYEWRRHGQTLSLADAAIGATALHHSLTLLTDNQKHFPFSGLSLQPLP